MADAFWAVRGVHLRHTAVGYAGPSRVVTSRWIPAAPAKGSARPRAVTSPCALQLFDSQMHLLARVTAFFRTTIQKLRARTDSNRRPPSSKAVARSFASQ